MESELCAQPLALSLRDLMNGAEAFLPCYSCEQGGDINTEDY
jgi:hypothetical protein